jgi:YVTN family beta-propeller protein
VANYGESNTVKTGPWLVLLGGVLLAQPPQTQHKPLLAAAAPNDGVVNLYRVSRTQLQLLKAVPVGKSPGQMCLDPTGSTLFVGVHGQKGAAAIDLNRQTVAGSFSDDGIQSPDGCVVSPDGQKLYLTDQKANAVFVFSTGSRRLLKKIAVAEDPRRGLFLPNGKLLVTSSEGNSLSLIDPVADNVVRTVEVAPTGWEIEPRIMALTHDRKLLAIANVAGDVLAWYRPETLDRIAEIGVRRSPQALVMAPDEKTIYVLSVFENLIAVVKDLGKNEKEWRVDGTIAVGPARPIAMVGDPSAQDLYVSRVDGTMVGVQVGSTTVTTILDAKGGGALVYRQ